MINFFIGLGASFVGFLIAVPVLLALARMFGLYAIVQERQCKVYVLFGKVVLVLDEPGLHFLLTRIEAARSLHQSGCRMYAHAP